MYIKGSLTKLTDLPKQDIKNFIERIRTVITDCDGVLWLQSKPIAGSSAVINRMRIMGKRILYVTNNSMKRQTDLVAKARKLGHATQQKEVITSSYLVRSYLQSVGFKKKAYVVGTTAIARELEGIGVRYTGMGPDVMQGTVQKVVETYKPDPEIGAVVIGFDTFFSYPKIIKASTYLEDPNCLFIATNADERRTLHTDLVIPGTGSIVNAIKTSAKREPIILGKPHRYVAEAIINNHGVNPNTALMIGDKCNTDILLGTKCGFSTMLVLTGGTSLEDARRYKSSKNPKEKGLVADVYVERLGDLLPFLE